MRRRRDIMAFLAKKRGVSFTRATVFINEKFSIILSLHLIDSKSHHRPLDVEDRLEPQKDSFFSFIRSVWPSNCLLCLACLIECIGKMIKTLKATDHWKEYFDLLHALKYILKTLTTWKHTMLATGTTILAWYELCKLVWSQTFNEI